MDNNLKSVPQRKLLRDNRNLSAVCSEQIAVWQSNRGMQGEMKEKHPCESEWYAKALRQLLVQYKESIGRVICKFLRQLYDSPSFCQEEAAFIVSPKPCARAFKSTGQLDEKSSAVPFEAG